MVYATVWIPLAQPAKAFRRFDLVSGFQISKSPVRNGGKSPAVFQKFRFAETIGGDRLDHGCHPMSPGLPTDKVLRVCLSVIPVGDVYAH